MSSKGEINLYEPIRHLIHSFFSKNKLGMMVAKGAATFTTLVLVLAGAVSSEFCSGYIDAKGTVHKSFQCPQFCCGSRIKKYCCSDEKYKYAPRNIANKGISPLSRIIRYRIDGKDDGVSQHQGKHTYQVDHGVLNMKQQNNRHKRDATNSRWWLRSSTTTAWWNNWNAWSTTTRSWDFDWNSWNFPTTPRWDNDWNHWNTWTLPTTRSWDYDWDTWTLPTTRVWDSGWIHEGNSASTSTGHYLGTIIGSVIGAVIFITALVGVSIYCSVQRRPSYAAAGLRTTGPGISGTQPITTVNQSYNGMMLQPTIYPAASQNQHNAAYNMSEYPTWQQPFTPPPISNSAAMAPPLYETLQATGNATAVPFTGDYHEDPNQIELTPGIAPPPYSEATDHMYTSLQAGGATGINYPDVAPSAPPPIHSESKSGNDGGCI